MQHRSPTPARALGAGARTLGVTLGATVHALGTLATLACGPSDARGPGAGAGAPGAGAPAASGADTSGRQLAARYCQRCHLLPAPALLDRPTWDHYILPRMARRLGLRGVGDPTGLEGIEGGLGGRIIRAAHVYPDSALLSRAEWARLAAYYLREAPAALPRPATPPVTVGLPGFRVRVASLRVPVPMVSLVQVDPRGGRVYVGDATPERSTLSVLDGRGRLVTSHPIPSPVTNLRATGDTLGLLFVGQLNPSDVPRGSLAVVTAWRPGAAPAVAWQVDTLQRPVFASYADLNADGLEDAVVSEFGNQTGRLAWYERLPGGGSRRHLLAAQPGALTTVVRDVDGDRRPDVVALTGQADEGVWLFRNRGAGQFTREPLLRFPPSYGSAGMELVDVNGDGHPDVVYANGDNGDYPSPPKPYHGVRVFLNDGRGRFAEQYFFPMPGAYKALARDFDGDGDVDLAAIAFYVDEASAAPRSFVYLENQGGPAGGGLQFRARTVADANRGRWLTMDAGDVDRDGDEDLVLGSFAHPGAPAVLMLENTNGARPRPPARQSVTARR